MRFQQQLTQITGTVGVSGTVAISGTVFTQTQQRLLGTFTNLATPNGSFTVTGLLAQDTFLLFVPETAVNQDQPITLTVTDPTFTSLTYGVCALTGHTYDFCSVAPLVSNSVKVNYVVLGSHVNPVNVAVYACPVQPFPCIKVLNSVVSNGNVAVGAYSMIPNTSLVRLKSAKIFVQGGAAIGAGVLKATNAYSGIYETICSTPGALNGVANVEIDLRNYVASGAALDTTTHTLDWVVNAILTSANLNVMYEDLRTN